MKHDLNIYFSVYPDVGQVSGTSSDSMYSIRLEGQPLNCMMIPEALHLSLGSGDVFKFAMIVTL